MSITFPVSKARCPLCGTPAGAHDSGQEPPAPRQVCVCERCGAVLTFDESLHLRVASRDELAQLDGPAQGSLQEKRRRVLGVPRRLEPLVLR